MAACSGGSSSSSSGGSGSGSGSSAIRIASIFGEKRPNMCVTENTHQKSNPHIGTGTPRIGLGRDLSIFQIGESQNRFGVHSNLGTNICTTLFHKDSWFYCFFFELRAVLILSQQPQYKKNAY